MGKSGGLKKVKKKNSSVKFRTVKAAKQKRVGYLFFDVNWKKIVKQSRFNFQGCEFHGLITVKDCPFLMSTSSFVKTDPLSLPY